MKHFKEKLLAVLLGWLVFLFFGLELYTVSSTIANIIGVIILVTLCYSTYLLIKIKINEKK